jgi:hypothetical protein
MHLTPSRSARVFLALLVTFLLLAAAFLLPGADASDATGGAEEHVEAAHSSASEEIADPAEARRPVPGTRAAESSMGSLPSPAFVAAERRRIQGHLARVEAELSEADVSHLSPEVQAARARQLQVLRDYRERGIFPRNLEVPHGKVPVFVDDRGVHCAVGYLMHRSGADDLVDRIASTRNLARVPELVDEPGLSEWLNSVGLSVDEAARIQPQYCGTGGVGWGVGPCPSNEPEVRYPFSDYLLASLGTGSLNGIMVGVNVVGTRRDDAHTGRAVAGLASGLAGIGLGAWGLHHGADASGAGWANLALGSFSAAAGVLALRRAGASGGDRFVEDDAEELEGEGGLSLSVTPSVAPARQGGAGVSVTLRW